MYVKVFFHQTARLASGGNNVGQADQAQKCVIEPRGVPRPNDSRVVLDRIAVAHRVVEVTAWPNQVFVRDEGRRRVLPG